jgi:Protein of unknown function (DUF4238)
MSGRKQHYIPQSVQRAFEASRTGTKPQVYVFRKSRKAYLSAVDGSAAERDFYSNPLVDGNGALDDQITVFEGEHLAPMLQALRNVQSGAVDTEIASITVAHLAFRTAHVRTALSTVADDGIAQMQTILADTDAMRRFAGVDSMRSDSPITVAIRDTLAEMGANDWSEKHRNAAERLLVFRVRERFDDLVPNTTDAMLGRLLDLKDAISESVPKAHARVLKKSLVPEERVKPLRRFSWYVISAEPENEHFILPDCVVVAKVTSSTHLQPFAMTAPDEVTAVIMPLSAKQLLVGGNFTDEVVQAGINQQLARCSLDFFVSSRQDPETVHIASTIGECAKDLHVSLDDESLDVAAPIPSESPSDVCRLKIRVPSGRFGEAAKKAIKALTARSFEASSSKSIESIVIPANLRAELQALLKRPPTDDELHGVAFGHVEPLQSENLWKCRVVLPRNVVESFLQQHDSETRLSALRVIKFNLGRVYHFHCWAEQCSEIFDNTQRSPWEQCVAKIAFRAGSEYFGGLSSARHELAPLPDGDQLQLLATILSFSFAGLTESRERFFVHRDTDQLVRELVQITEFLFAAFASGCGLLEAKNKNLDRNSDAGIALTRAGLWDWGRLFARDLQRYYESRYRWNAESLVNIFGSHVERVFWSVGAFVSKSEKGHWIDVADDNQLSELKRMLSN